MGLTLVAGNATAIAHEVTNVSEARDVLGFEVDPPALSVARIAVRPWGN